MTPRPANFDHNPEDRSAGSAQRTRLTLVRDTAAASSSDELSVFRRPAKATLPAAAHLDATLMGGTVAAAVASSNLLFYNAESDTLLSNTPLTVTGHRELPVAPKPRPTDLIMELREISGQVNRMMSQVDRAIHRLGEHAGPPIRR